MRSLGSIGHIPAWLLLSIALAGAIVLSACDVDLRPVPLGYIYGLYDWDWEAAERAFRKAIELNPRYATGHHWYSILLFALGRFEEAEREVILARQLDPGSLIINREYGVVAFLGRRFDLAIRRLLEVIEMDPSFGLPYVTLGDIYLCQQRYDDAIEAYQRAHKLSASHAPVFAGRLGYAYGLAGRRTEALEELRTLTERAKREYIPARTFASIHAGLGDLDRAFEYLDQAIDDRELDLAFYKFGPGADPLRVDPRFDKLIERMNFPDEPPAPKIDPIEIPVPVIGVLPFEITRENADADFLADEIPASVIDALSGLSGVRVVPRSSSFRHRDSTATIQEIGEALKADFVLTGQIVPIRGRPCPPRRRGDPAARPRGAGGRRRDAAGRAR